MSIIIKKRIQSLRDIMIIFIMMIFSFSSFFNFDIKKAEATGSTFVSLQFDDGATDQLNALPILESHGMKGTFFVSSGRIGLSGFMNKNQILDLQAKGHEIGGHTANHLDVATLSLEDQKSQIINDRNALLGMGFAAKNFSYPFGSYTSTTKNVVKEAGYSTARTVGGIGCSGCRTAETIPPKDLYATETPSSIKSSTSLATLQGYVTQAEQNGGGWVQIVMHHVDNSGQTYSISPDTLNSFLTWLQGRSSLGTTVKTVKDVMGGTVSSPPTPILNKFKNSSLEIDLDNNSIPDNWELTGWGTSTFKNTRVNDAHSGSWAEKIEILTASGGDRKIVSNRNDLNSSPDVVKGKSYRFSAWYKSNVPVRSVVYYKNTVGKWVWLAESTNITASTNWNQTTFTIPTLPSDAVKVSAGVMIKNSGYMVVDDLSMVEN